MNVWIGIDVSQRELSVWARPLGAHWSVANTAAGWAQWVERLSAWSVQRVLLEATGGYEQGVLAALTAAGLPTVRINPRRARHFAAALGRRAKTDPIDAAVLAHMAQTLALAATPPPSAAHQRLRALVQRRGQVVAPARRRAAPDAPGHRPPWSRPACNATCGSWPRGSAPSTPPWPAPPPRPMRRWPTDSPPYPASDR
jgi:transposase